MKTLSLLCLLFAATTFVGARPAAQARPGSIYNPDQGMQGLIADKTARRPGDLLTVIISETQDLKNEEKSTLNKTTNLDYSLDSFNLKSNLFNTPLPDIGASSADIFNGNANYEKKGEFTARITAIVSDVLPNGNMVISGRREIRIDNETKLIEFSGIVRRYDVRVDNTVQSELVAEARVSYTGEGTLTNTTNRIGIGTLIHDAIMWLWPF
ncbi:MAG: flagellar basal body L-ring protein FlgH [Planctomycetota bacterium]